MISNKRNIRNKSAFTLVETMIVFIAIGIVSVFLMPFFIASHNERQTVSHVQKSYTVVEEAFKRAIMSNGPIEGWFVQKNKGAEDVFNTLSSHLMINKICGTGATGNCVAEKYGRLNNSGTDNGANDKRYYKTVLADGSAFAIRIDDVNCKTSKGKNDFLKKVCGIAFFDINGPNGPNVAGKDKFEFYVTSLGIFPRGAQAETSAAKLNGNDGCSSTKAKGYGCTAWILVRNNMDYLRTEVKW